jgi:NAD(P)-dependent dehydrogenase (short-subunit alcohol dehydrogenase family)
VAIIGASRGIGLAMAVSFAQAGASQIIIGARSSLDACKTSVLTAANKANRTAPKVFCVKIDVTSQQSTEDAAKLVEKEFGKLDILVINSGILGSPNRIIESKVDEWWEVWNVNLKGPYAVSRAFFPLMLKGGDKTIITTASVGAHVCLPGFSAYQPSKLAVLRLMEFITKEYEDQGVSAFSIHPGNVPTDIVGGPDGLSDALKPSRCSLHLLNKKLKRSTFLMIFHKVFTESPEISADTIVYLTRKKRQWLGGRYINVTWDMPELMAQEDDIVKGDNLKVRLVL